MVIVELIKQKWDCTYSTNKEVLFVIKFHVIKWNKMKWNKIILTREKWNKTKQKWLKWNEIKWEN